jgi:hypothetical protein
MPRLPLAHRPGGDAKGGGDPGDRPALNQALDHQQSTVGRGLGILMEVHPVAPQHGCEHGSDNLPPQRRVDNLHSNDS